MRSGESILNTGEKYKQFDQIFNADWNETQYHELIDKIMPMPCFYAAEEDKGMMRVPD